ncbi:MAG TPA: ATP-binding protein [Candidatus Polarisedimenticolaceae bacterium]
MSRARLALVPLVPLLIVLAGEVLARRATGIPPEAARRQLEREARVYQASFRRLLSDAEKVARCALERGPEEALGCASPVLARRLEGAGVASVDGGYLEWIGSPAEARDRRAEAHPRWVVRREGMRRSLLARTAADATGRFGAASFALDLDSPLPGASLDDLMPTSARGHVVATADFEGSVLEAFGAPFPGDQGLRVHVDLLDPKGVRMGVATFEPVAPGFRATAIRGASRAWAVLAFGALALTVPGLRRRLASPRVCLAFLALVVACRALAIAVRLPSALLPRSVGSPSAFGTAKGLGLAASPGDLLLTMLSVLALVWALRQLARRASPAVARVVALVAGGGAVAAPFALGELGRALAVDARVTALSLVDAASSPAQATLLLALVTAIVAAAALVSAAWLAYHRATRGSPRGRRAVECAALAAAILVVSLSMQRASDRSALARLRSEYAPQVLQQESQRRVALEAAVAEAAASLRVREILDSVDIGEAESVAYRMWVSGPLFHRGYQSSLQVFDPSGTPRGLFAFGVPPLGESPPASIPPKGTIVVRDREQARLAASLQRFVHVEAGIYEGDRPIGVVVGHVLDDPSNLPFLPAVAPFLAAIGPGAPRPPGAREPDYVLYDTDGGVLLHTVLEPPAASPELRDAARRGATVRIADGSGRHVGLPLLDGERLHLLLLPERSAADTVAGFVRLAVATFAIGLALAALARLARPGGAARLVAALRGSFYRKLLASILVASVAPLVAFALFLRGYVESRVEAGLAASSAGVANAVRRVVEDYAAVALEESAEETPARLNDATLAWLRGVVGQEIHLYEGGVMTATSKPELFASGLLLPRLAGEVQRAVVLEGLPYLVRWEHLGELRLPVAYARVDLAGRREPAVVALPLVAQERQAARGVERLLEMLLLATVLLTGALALVAAFVARSVARPVRDLVRAAARIARGDYAARAATASRDEVRDLVDGFNAMAAALAAQRADLERRRDHMEALLRNATTGVVSTDPEGRIVTANPAAEALIAAVGGELAPGASLSAAIARVPALAPLASAVARPPAVPAEPEEIDLLLDGGVRRLRLVRAPLPDPDGGPPGTLNLVDDVTDLMRSNQLAAWAEMARAIAHEIKNPLTPIQLSTEHLARLLRDRGQLPSPELEACLETVLKQVRNLREIASEFGAYAKLPALSPEPIDAASFLRDVAAPYVAAPPAGVTIVERHLPAPSVAVDRRVLARAVVNLVENAIQAMPDGGTLALTSAPRGPDAVELVVADSGVGLSADARRRLFEPYFSTKSSGTGLGLAIVRRAVEGHGGRIEVEDAAGGGTLFRIVLPAAP